MSLNMWDRGVCVVVTWLVCAVLGGQAPARAYQETTVTDGGTLAGRVVLNGAPPPARIFHLVFSPNMDFCGSISDGKGNRLLKEFRVAADGGFEGVVVAVVGIERGKAFTYAPEIQLEHCRVSPFITPVRNHHPISIVNKDRIAHDIQAYTAGENYTFAMFNKPMLPDSAATKDVRMRKGQYVFRTQCGVHDFMQSWGIAVGNPYFAVTGADGRYTIPDLPPGTYDVIAWHPHMKVRAQQVVVGPSGRVALDFRFDAAEVEIPLHDLQTAYRLETALDTRTPPIPSIELQTP